MKPQAKESIIKALTKVCAEENIERNLAELSDAQLKERYLQLQTVRSGTFPLGIGNGQDFLSTMKNGQLNRISFRDSYKYGLRRLTFKEYLLLCDYVKENPGVYPDLE